MMLLKKNREILEKIYCLYVTGSVYAEKLKN